MTTNEQEGYIFGWEALIQTDTFNIFIKFASASGQCLTVSKKRDTETFLGVEMLLMGASFIVRLLPLTQRFDEGREYVRGGVVEN